MRETTRTSRSISSRGVNECSVLISLSLHKREAHRRRHVYGLPRRRQAAGCWINVENDDVVGFLVLRQQVRASGINREMPRRFAAGQNLSERFQRTFFLIDCKNGDAVVTAIRSVEILPGWVHGNLGGFFRAGVIIRQS